MGRTAKVLKGRSRLWLHRKQPSGVGAQAKVVSDPNAFSLTPLIMANHGPSYGLSRELEKKVSQENLPISVYMVESYLNFSFSSLTSIVQLPHTVPASLELLERLYIYFLVTIFFKQESQFHELCFTISLFSRSSAFFSSHCTH